MIRLFLPGPLTADELRRLTAEREGLFKQDLMAGPLSTVAGVEPFLAALRAKDVRTALATSAASGNADLALRRVGLDKTFDARITAADVTAGKPDPEVYLKAAASVGVPPSRCLVVEDALPGVQAAKAAGAFCLGLTTSATAEDLLQAGADFLAANFLSLPGNLQP